MLTDPETAAMPATPTPQNKSANREISKSNKKMHATDALHVVVRLLPSTGLEGAFRVHVLPESLSQANLKLGDVCEISSEDGSTGFGIAWRADDRMGNRPKNRPAKMTETIRSAFGFEEGSRVTISQTDTKIFHADKIILSDVTPGEYNQADDQIEACWETRTKTIFSNCDALAIGIAFDVPGKKKLLRKRFYIENIESRDAPTDSPCLFSFSDSTQLVFPEGVTASTVASQSNGVGTTSGAAARTTNGTDHNSRQQHQLNTERIGGLLEQCRRLNRQLRRLLDTTKHLEANEPILIHGYEGTGKTMLLNALGESGFRKVLRLNRSTLNGGSVAKNQSIIQTTFQEAAAEQPSLILLDNLQRLSPADDIAYSDTLGYEIEKALDSRIMIVGATRSPLNIESSLLAPGRFVQLIELPIPDLSAREQILNVLRRKPVFARDSLSSSVAARTHGFTGKDVAILYRLAKLYAVDRYEDECDELAMAQSATPPAYEEIVIHIDGSVASRPNGEPVHPTADVTLKDFETAFQEVRPTALREIFTEKPKIQWSDIGGSNDVKTSFDEIIGWPLQNKDLLAKFQYQPPKGVLLYGPPGCSKTLTAQAVANTYNFNFIAIKGAELISMYVGESERAVREVFRKAKAAAPCVIFFDEIDAIGSDRDSTGTKGLNVLTTLLNEMDGFESLRDVFILAATNKPETLDSALMRPGRFDSHVYLGPPDEAARKEILAIATRGVALASDVAFDSLVADTSGYSGAEIVRICQSAKEPALRRQIANRAEDVRVTADDFGKALARTRKGITAEMLEAYEAFSKNERPA